MMTNQGGRRVKIVIGPDGSAMTPADLPKSTDRRWVIRRKAQVVAGVRGGLLSMEEACVRYALTLEEYLSWQAAVDQFGMAGLRTTKVQHYRAKTGASSRQSAKWV